MRETLKKLVWHRWTYFSAVCSVLCYTVLLYMLGVVWTLTPAYALMSTTGYARVINSSAQNALSVAQRSLVANSLGASIASASGSGSVAVRLVASSVGWPALGVLAGLTLLQIVLSQQEAQNIREGARPPGGVEINNQPMPSGTTLTQCPGGASCQWFYAEYINVPTPHTPPNPSGGCIVANAGSVPSGWAGWFSDPNAPQTCLAYRASSNPNNQANTTPGADPTATQIADHIQSLPANDPNSIESNTSPVGTTSQPSPASSVSTVPVPASGVETSVIPASQVQGSDAVVNPNAQPAPGTPSTQTATQQTTGSSSTTTTTTTNPDGSTTTTTTKTETEEAPDVSCSSGEHDQRTFGSILQEYITQWQGSGLLGALNLIKNLVWPTALPTYTLQSSIMGTFTFNFNAWSSTLLALRSIIIAIASFVAYRIIFVGSK